MRRYRLRGPAALLACAALIAGLTSTGCRQSKKTPAAETQSATTAPGGNAPITISGCLKAGEADQTFVLTATAQEQGGAPATTYQLTAGEGVDLRQHVGERVEVSGALGSQAEVASRTPSEAQRPTGTSGRPTVNTETELDIKRVTVTSVKTLTNRCQP